MKGDDKPAGPPAETRRKLKLVILDDDLADFYEDLVTGFTQRFQIQKFIDGDRAWAELSATDPDVLITDLFHPGISGLQLLKLLAARKVTYPILVVSGDPDSLVGFCAKECPDLKVTQLGKPFELGDFYNYISGVAP
jgi:FixJ family two-component response regulator